MRLDDQEQSRNLEDRRGSRRGGGGFPGFHRGGGGGRKIGIGTIVLALAGWYFFNINPLAFLGGADVFSGFETTQSAPQRSAQTAQQSDAEGVFMSKVLKTTETVWSKIFAQHGWGAYKEPRLVLFSDLTRTACGSGQGQMGPFYCPQDQTVYIDMSFFRDTGRRLGVKGDFAQGYVLAHEIGHHIQNQMGILDKVNRIRMTNPSVANQVSVASELQADCFAGIWANHLQKQGNIIEHGDIEEAMNAASAVGDDRIQKSQQGYVVPDSFTHGSSKQRIAWFERGLASGDVRQCDTFK